MNRTELTLAIAFALILSALIGWIARWMFERLNRGGPVPETQMDGLAEELLGTQTARAEAEQRARELEAELRRKLVQSEADRDAAMEGLRTVRAELSQVREQLAAVSRGSKA
jgi:prophage endopeptidase